MPFDEVIVLTGGRSERMGTEKALLRYQGQAQLVRVVEEFAPLSPRIVVSCRHEQVREFEPLLRAEARAEWTEPGRLAWAHDAPGTSTPFEAIEALLATRSGRRVLLLGVDMPLLARRAALQLAEQSAKIVCFSGQDGQLEPFPSAWQLDDDLVAALHLARARQHFGFRRFFAEHDARALTAEEPAWLENVNTPERAQAADAFLRSHSSKNANMRSRLR